MCEAKQAAPDWTPCEWTHQKPRCIIWQQSLTAQVTDLPARELVPGDIVELRVGDKVPADCRVIQLKTATLRSEQASLTGESVAVLKSTDEVKDEQCELQGKDCMLFAGTAIANGNCVCVVNDIGRHRFSRLQRRRMIHP